jgi:biopolymer transport protein ExbD
MKAITFFLLLAFLFSCKSIRNEKNEKTLNPLKVISAEKDTIPQPDHFIFIDSSGIFYLDKIQIQPKEIAEKLKTFKKAKSDLKIQLEVSKIVKMDKVLEIMNVCKEEDIELKIKSE